jgi:hypothetical protein
MMDAYSTNAAPGKPFPTDAVGEVQGMVSRVLYDNLALGTTMAFKITADGFCIGTRRARGFYYGEAREVLESELADARVAFRGYLLQPRADLAWEDAQIVHWLDEDGESGALP